MVSENIKAFGLYIVAAFLALFVLWWLGFIKTGASITIKNARNKNVGSEIKKIRAFSTPQNQIFGTGQPSISRGSIGATELQEETVTVNF